LKSTGSPLFFAKSFDNKEMAEKILFGD